MAVPQAAVLGLGAVLFAIGFYGVLTRTNAVAILMAVELMLNSANLNFVAFGQYSGDPSGMSYALISIALAAAEVAVGLAILITVFKNRGTIDVSKINLLRW